MSAILIRALEPSDIDFLFEIENDTDLWQVSQTHQPFSAKLLREYIAQADKDIYEVKQFRFAIEHENNLVGFIDLFDFDPKNRRAGVGIVIHKKYRGNNYAKAALKMLIKYGFDILFLHQLYANISVENTPSIRLFESLGFQLAGVKKEWNFNGTAYTDEALYQLINEKM